MLILFIAVSITTGFIRLDSNIDILAEELEVLEIATETIIETKSRSIGFENESEVLKVKEIDATLEEKTEQFIQENKVAIEDEMRKKNNVTTNPFEVTNLTEMQFNKILKDTGLEGQGAAYKNLEEEYNINGVYAIAVAFLESGYGKHKAGRNNFYGMKGSKGWMNFKTPEDNILYFGELMNKDMYKGKSLESIAKIYCPPTYKSWIRKVNIIMQNNFDKLTEGR